MVDTLFQFLIAYLDFQCIANRCSTWSQSFFFEHSKLFPQPLFRLLPQRFVFDASEIKLLERMRRVECKSARRRFDRLRCLVRLLVTVLHVAFAAEIARRINLVPDRVVLPEHLPGKTGVCVARIPRGAADVSPARPPVPDLRIHAHLPAPDGRSHPRILLKNQIQTRRARKIAQTVCPVVLPFAAKKLLEPRPRICKADFPARIRVGNAPQTLEDMSLRHSGGKERMCALTGLKITGNLKRGFLRRQIETLL